MELDMYLSTAPRLNSNEGAEQEAVVEFCRWNHLPIVHVPNEGKRSHYTARKLKAEGMEKGFPDLFLPIPTVNYHGLAIEMKYGKNRPTEDQKEWLKKLHFYGYRACVCYSADEAIKVIIDYMKDYEGRLYYGEIRIPKK